MRTNGSRSPEQILREVETVRSEMNSTLSAIERKLTPGQLLDQGLDYLRNSGANEFVSNLGTSVKHNPLPVTLVGIGLAWLMASNRHGPSYASGPSVSDMAAGVSSMGRSLEEGASEVATGARERVGQARQTLVDAAQTARERFDDARGRLSDTAQSARQSVSETAQAAREKWYQARQAITDTAYSARETVRRGADTAKLQYERARSGYDWMVREQPLALGAIGLAIGAIAAAAAPRTTAENEWMGEASDRLAERAKEAGREQLETATQKVKEAVEPLVSETQQAPENPQVPKTEGV